MRQYVKKRIRSFGYAFKGLWDLLCHHPNAQIHLLAILVVVTAGFIFGINKYEWLAVLLCCVLVLSLEAVNSAIEYLADTVSREHHPLLGKAKDIAAAAVLVAAIGAVVVAGIVFLPKFGAIWGDN